MFLGICQKSLQNKEKSSRALADFQDKQLNIDISKAQ